MDRGHPVSLDAADVIAAWRRADERLYPLVMVDPDRYTRVVSVVRATADRLDGHTTNDLIRERRRGRELVASSCAAVGVPFEALGDAEIVADAAFGLRHREVLAQQRRREVADRIAAARAAGEARVVLTESGRADQPGVTPYERIEMRLDDGRGLRSTVDVDPDSFQPVHAVEHLRLDPSSGAIIDAGAAATARTFATREAWEATVAAWRDESPQQPDPP